MIIDLTAWHWPQYVVITLYANSFIMGINKHNTITETKNNAFTRVVAILIGVFILIKGGFF